MKKEENGTEKLNKKAVLKKLVILVILLALFLPFCWYENHHLVTTFYEYKNSKVPAGFDGYRIVQISDFHNSRFGKDNSKLLGKIRGINPDIIVITGDIVDLNHTNIDVAVDFAKEAAKIADVYYVTGNHEYWLGETEFQKLIHGLCDAGVNTMANTESAISNGNDNIVIIGVDDNYLSGTILKEMVQSQPEDVLTITLAHEPQYFEKYASAGTDIVFSGHAHGGQFILPFVGAVYAPDQGLFPKLTQGCHEKDGTTMYVSRGLGNSVFPLRLFNDPEIVCVDLLRE